MPELPEDLRAMLHDRAENAPAAPAPTDALVRRVRRRRAARATLAVATSVAGVAAVAVTAVALQPTGKTASPVTSQPSITPDDKYEFCTGQPYLQVYVAVHPTELKFARGCYKVVAGATGIVFNNPQAGVKHDLVITREGESAPVFRSAVLDSRGPNAALTHTIAPLPSGDYYLTCTIHSSMHAQLVVR